MSQELTVSQLGRLGGSVKSKAKAESSRRNVAKARAELAKARAKLKRHPLIKRGEG